MATFTLSLPKTLLHEGTYANDPDDSGGETYKGISRNAHPDWQGWNRIDIYKHKHWFPKTLDEDSELQNEIEQFYHTNFWQPINADQIENQAIANSIFDFAVNVGVKSSVWLAQSVINTEVVDGIIGSQTLQKLNTCNPDYFHLAFTIAKIKYYISIVKKRPINKKHLYGWIIRALYYT